ncbi:MAG: ABC transporter permease subunit, partial [Pseudomonadota bacterium]|nr:ABC transporter permease subunit [Pseudomonadota bacterium]
MQDSKAISGSTSTDGLWSEYRHWLIGAVVLVVSILIWRAQGGETVFPESWISAFPFADKVNEFDRWMRPFLQPTTRALGAGVTWFYEYIVDLLIFTQWQIVLVVLVLPAFAYGGLRLGLFAVAAVGSWLVLDMWDEAMETLSLMCISIAFSAIVGIALGIGASQSNRLGTVIKPILDTMQTLPAYIYLIPAFFLFGIGAPGAILATVIYALPPIVRLTNLGIRQVPAGIDEAATSFGATTRQSLIKVKIPLAIPAIKLGINQTVMMALALVVLATFIGAPGLGDIVLRGMQRLNVGKALEGGLAIVLMAILLDRVTHAMGQEQQRTDQGRTQIFRLFPQSLESLKFIRYLELGIDFVWRQIGRVGRGATHAVALIPCALIRTYDTDWSSRLRDFLLRHSFFIASLVLIWVMVLLDAY